MYPLINGQLLKNPKIHKVKRKATVWNRTKTLLSKNPNTDCLLELLVNLENSQTLSQ